MYNRVVVRVVVSGVYFSLASLGSQLPLCKWVRAMRVFWQPQAPPEGSALYVFS